jgi:hypothetical protein
MEFLWEGEYPVVWTVSATEFDLPYIYIYNAQ